MTPEKPDNGAREFWIGSKPVIESTDEEKSCWPAFKHDCSILSDRNRPAELIHVIERSYATKLEERLDKSEYDRTKFSAQIKADIKIIQKQKDKIERLEADLKKANILNDDLLSKLAKKHVFVYSENKRLEAENKALREENARQTLAIIDLDKCNDNCQDKIASLELKLDKAKSALNRIAMLGSSGMAYTSDFTEKVNTISRGTLRELGE